MAWLEDLMKRWDPLLRMSNLLADGGTVVVAVVAAAIAGIVWLNARSFPRILARQRRYLLKDAGIPPRAFDDVIQRRVRECLEFEHYSVYHEASWLAYLKSQVEESVHSLSDEPFPEKDPTGLSFSPRYLDLARLAKSYRRRAQALSSRRFPRAVNFPLLMAHIEMFRATADFLDRTLRQIKIYGNNPATAMMSNGIQFIRSPKPSARMNTFGLVTSWQRFRIMAETDVAKSRADEVFATRVVPATPEQLTALEAKFAQPTAFDGVVPAVRASRIECDAASGEVRMRLALVEMTWGAMHLSHRPGAQSVGDQQPGADERARERIDQFFTNCERAKYMSLALLPITTDNELLLVQRAHRYGDPDYDYPGQFAPGVWGVLEVLPPDARSAIVNELGFPSPSRAISVAADSLLGLDVHHDRVQWTGLGRICNEVERHTQVLVGHARLRLDRHEVAESVLADASAAGRWEHTGEVFAINMTDFDAVELMHWFATDRRLMPHTRVAGICTVSSHLGVDIPDESTLMRPYRRPRRVPRLVAVARG